MTTKTLILPEKAFFHARPAAVVSSAARRFESVVMIGLGVEIADAKNAIALMRLSALKGRPIDIIAQGSDEEAAVAAVEAAILEIFKTC